MNAHTTAAGSEAEALYESAFLLLGESRFREAVEHLSRAVVLDPGQPKYVTALAKAYEFSGEMAKSREILQRAVILRRRQSRQP